MAESRLEASKRSSLLLQLRLSHTVPVLTPPSITSLGSAVHCVRFPSLILLPSRLFLSHVSSSKHGPLKAETQVLAVFWIKAHMHAHLLQICFSVIRQPSSHNPLFLQPYRSRRGILAPQEGHGGKGALMDQKQTSGVINLASPSTLCLSSLIM